MNISFKAFLIFYLVFELVATAGLILGYLNTTQFLLNTGSMTCLLVVYLIRRSQRLQSGESETG